MRFNGTSSTSNNETNFISGEFEKSQLHGMVEVVTTTGNAEDQIFSIFVGNYANGARATSAARWNSNFKHKVVDSSTTSPNRNNWIYAGVWDDTKAISARFVKLYQIY